MLHIFRSLSSTGELQQSMWETFDDHIFDRRYEKCCYNLQAKCFYRCVATQSHSVRRSVGLFRLNHRTWMMAYAQFNLIGFYLYLLMSKETKLLLFFPFGDSFFVFFVCFCFVVPFNSNWPLIAGYILWIAQNTILIFGSTYFHEFAIFFPNFCLFVSLLIEMCRKWKKKQSKGILDVEPNHWWWNLCVLCFCFQTSTCLASCVECLWVSNSQKTHLKESLWLYCGGYGMRVWLPVFPRDADSGYGSRHTFMSKRIMLSFALKLYPLAILFEDAIILGVENDTVVYTSDASSHFSLPFCILERAVSVLKRSLFFFSPSQKCYFYILYGTMRKNGLKTAKLNH